MPKTQNQNALDDGVEGEIELCLNLDDLKSFFLYAGAGSGKTRSLVNALQWIRDNYYQRLWLNGQRIGVITYTNAACDEIKERTSFDILIEVSTIHSFAWSLVGTYQTDIRNWLRENLTAEIAQLSMEQAKGRAGTKASSEREASITNKTNRLSEIDTIKRFQYSPTGDNRSRDALSHEEVISMTVAFLTTKPALQNILINRYPILLIDESQDTKKGLMDALFDIQQKNQKTFCLGLFGDTMQRIYADGKVGLESTIPADWAKPVKKMNHRCPGRVIQLLNKMRAETDGVAQIGRSDKPEGHVRLFILSVSISKKSMIESKIASRMAEITGDSQWNDDRKNLILEHHMAAKRLGFGDLFDPLYKVERLRTSLLDGSLPSVNFFAKQILPFVEAVKSGDQFTAMTIIKKDSPFLDATILRAEKEQLQKITDAKNAAAALMVLWKNGTEPSFGDVLNSVYQSGLFEVPEMLKILASRSVNTSLPKEVNEIDPQRDEAVKAWDEVMPTPFKQVAAYDRYVSGISTFDTHQGIKGREFPRVMVIIDDEDARGFMFSYEKLFGVKEKSETDLKNESGGIETTIDRTRRLLYVTCSRAENSLAIVIYTANPQKAKEHALSAGWFNEDEIEVILSDP